MVAAQGRDLLVRQSGDGGGRGLVDPARHQDGRRSARPTSRSGASRRRTSTSLVQAKDPQTLVIKLPEPVSTDLVLYLARRRLARHRRQEDRTGEREERRSRPELAEGQQRRQRTLQADPVAAERHPARATPARITGAALRPCAASSCGTCRNPATCGCRSRPATSTSGSTWRAATSRPCRPRARRSIRGPGLGFYYIAHEHEGSGPGKAPRAAGVPAHPRLEAARGDDDEVQRLPVAVDHSEGHAGRAGRRADRLPVRSRARQEAAGRSGLSERPEEDAVPVLATRC